MNDLIMFVSVGLFFIACAGWMEFIGKLREN